MQLDPAPLHLREGDAIVVPLPWLDLPAEIELLGERWLRKAEFHLTAAHVGTLAGRVRDASGAGEEEAAALVEAALVRATWECGFGAISLRDEWWIVRDGDARTIVVMAEAPDLEPLHRRLAGELGFEPVPPPAHVTVYTGPEDRHGIGLHTDGDLARLTEPLGGPEAERLRAALAAAFPG